MAAPSPSPSPSKVSLKLVIDKKARKVLFAEADKETVDFLCSILTLPVGTVIRLLSKQGMVGCLPNLYQSIESLNDDYIQPNEHKDTVLKPMTFTFQSNSLVHQFLTYVPQKEKKIYRCGLGHGYGSDKSWRTCPHCKYAMNLEVKLVEGNGAGEVAGGGGGSGRGGFVNGLATYMVMDDLVVVPLSTSALLNIFTDAASPLSTSALLNMFTDAAAPAFEEKVVDLDMDMALKLLEISLQSKNVLTTVFL